LTASLLQLNPAIPVQVFIHDVWEKAWAHVLIDYGVEADIMWVCFLDEGGGCWTVRNGFVRAAENRTIGRWSSWQDSSAPSAS
jgi:hypothetical protein